MSRGSEYSTQVPLPVDEVWKALSVGVCDCGSTSTVSNERCSAHHISWGGPGRRHELSGHIRPVAKDRNKRTVLWSADFSDRLGHNRIVGNIDLQVNAMGDGSEVNAQGVVRMTGSLLPAEGVDELRHSFISSLVDDMSERAELAPVATRTNGGQAEEGWIAKLAVFSGVFGVVSLITVIVWRRSRS